MDEWHDPIAQKPNDQFLAERRRKGEPAWGCDRGLAGCDNRTGMECWSRKANGYFGKSSRADAQAMCWRQQYRAMTARWPTWSQNRISGTKGGKLMDIVDISTGIAIAWRHTTRAGLLAAIAVSLFYLIVASATVPHLWIDPLGPLLKVFPILA
jgi:DoxX-like family